MIVAISGMTIDRNGGLGNAGAGKSTVAKQLVNEAGFVEVGLGDPLKRIVQEVYDFTDYQLWGPSESRNAPDVRYYRGDPPTSSAEAMRPTMEYEDQLLCNALDGAVGAPVPMCNNYLTPRYALQRLGTEWGRDCYADTWVELAVRTARKIGTGDYTYDPKSGLRGAIVPADFSGSVRTKTDVVISDVRFKRELSYLRASGAYLVRVVRPVNELYVDNKHISEHDLSDVQDDDFDVILDNDGGLLTLQRRVALLIKRLGASTGRHFDVTEVFDVDLMKKIP